MFKTNITENFSLMVNSLKLAQRAELWDDEQNENIVEKLYVDPLPNDGLLSQVIQDNTVFLVGRKGTGKSTIFARAQEYFRKSKSEISAYVDVKTIYGKSQAKELNQDSDYYEKILLYEGFINEVISDLLKEVNKNLKQKNALFRLWKRKDLAILLSKLEDIKKETSKPTYKTTDILKTVNTTEKVATSNENEGSLSATATATNLKVKGSSSVRKKNSGANEVQDEYSHTLLRHFNLTDFISNITEALKNYGVKKLHIILDDFSEIDYEAQQIFVNTLLAPLNNWSDKFIRFKVGAYPKRIFYGDIDKGKIDEIHLDYYELYKVKDLPELEKKATEFLNRLLEARFKYYLNAEMVEIFQIDKENTWESYLELMFQATMNIPRILGHILHYCYQSAIIYNKKITKSLIEHAAQKYYENQIKYYFEKTNYLKEAFDEKLDRYSQQILVNLLTEKAKDLKNHLRNEDTELFNKIPTNKIPSSHFFINKEYEKFLHSLELNYFVSKYYEQADRDGIVISIYAINYGLCREQNINFGRPKGHTKYRKYFISRHFNYDKVIQQYLIEQKHFVCTECGYEYQYSEYDILHKTGMMCYLGCKNTGTIKESFKFKDENLFEGIKREKLLPEIELDILHVLSQNKKANLYASLIARELDCSHQLVSKRSEKLQNAELIRKGNEVINGVQRRIYELTEKAEVLYFSNET
ncbi:hypothetical protein ABEW72_02340 [Bacillus velezensis]|uniref:hypothetical protein n=1 Tax=Bacillus velezensis TaxID=492670 RepID=UPI00203D51C3|nr:hypothetical protein [Bacillus velezensis]MCM3105141.1 hypothetical protein [Bacillus velezensis]MDQ9148236.1 hypothetical protein [Bacillus velezensis]MEC2185610.1 hypothetical protein [Bacillus velezensis]MED3449852.1 hypothetical protein [Bacillus velezensis]